MKALLTKTNVQLGDTPGAFLGSQYGGLVFELPFSVTWFDDAATEYKICVGTSSVETFGGWKGHPVQLNGREIGRILDSSNTAGVKESTEIVVARSDFPDVFADDAKARVSITVEKKDSQPGLLDDFVLEEIAFIGFAAKIGW